MPNLDNPDRDLSMATTNAGEALERAAREFTKHSGPSSTSQERDVFERDLRVAALKYARAYYNEAKEYGLIPEYERVKSCGAWKHPRRPSWDAGEPIADGASRCTLPSGHHGDHAQ